MQRLDAEEHCQKQPEYPEDYPTAVASEEKGETLNNDSEFLRTDSDLEINGETEDEYTRVP